MGRLRNLITGRELRCCREAKQQPSGWRCWTALVALLAMAILLPGGCDSGTGSAPLDLGDSVGVSSGGQEDIAQARQRIESGYLPDAATISVEGFLSEHDIPIDPPADAGELYASVGVAFRKPFGESAPMADVFVALGSTISLDNYQRPPLNVALVIDRSTSMKYTWDDPYGYYYQPYGGYYGYYNPFDPFFVLSVLFSPPPPPEPPPGPTKMDSVKAAVHGIIDQLGPEDVLTLVTFDDQPNLDFAPAALTDPDAARRVIDSIVVDGNTNIHDALRMAFGQVDAVRAAGRQNRVILFTDAQPNVGPTGSPEFLNLVNEYAARDIGLTLMGVGYDFGDELGRDISQSRGGNSYYLSSAERATEVIANDFRFFVAPAAYDLHLTVSIVDGVGIRDVFGVPDYVPGARSADIHVPTLFFSRREGGGGAVIVRLTAAQIPDFTTDATFGALALSYVLTDGTVRQQQTTLTLPAGTSPTAEPPFYSQPSLVRAAILLDTALVMRQATEMAAAGSRSAAADLIDAFLPVFDQATLGQSDRIDPTERGLKEERALLVNLRGVALSGYGYYQY